MKELYLAGQCKMLKEALCNIKGVAAVTGGEALAVNGERLVGVKVEYDPKKQDICGILEAYFSVANPYTVVDNPLEQTAVFYKSGEDMYQLEYYARFLQSRGHEPGAALGNLIVNDTVKEGTEIRPLRVRFGRLKEFKGGED